MSAHEGFVDDVDQAGDVGQYSPRIRAEVLDEMEQSGWFSHRPPAELSHGACVGHPEPNIWFGDEVEELEAKRICETCPVIDLCLGWAQRSGQKNGIWGGERMGGERRRPGAPTLERCKRGHDDWGYRANGKRWCKACSRLKERELRISKRATA